jgi:hypothetical protein
MTTPAWTLAGHYFETCSCDFVCPCVVTQLAGRPTQGSCTFAMAYQVSSGRFGEISLDGLGFIVIGFTPEEMGSGNWSAGVIVDERASAEQREAIVAIASGAAGGPMAALAGLITTFLGVESAPIRFSKEGVGWRVEAPAFVHIAAAPAMGIDPAAAEPLQLRNTGHPASSHLTLARAQHSQVDVFGLSWNVMSGRNNGQYAPFSWAGA